MSRRARVGTAVRAALPPFARRRPPIPDESDYPSTLRSVDTTVRIGRWLGICVLVCFLTGLYSHFVQHPLSWLTLPHRPVWIYRVTQGLHVTSGIAAIPLLGLKLWAVTPKFWTRPLLGGLRRILERASILVLIASVAFELISGLLNVAEFYPWTFFFPTVHYAVAWIAIGSVVVHIAVKLPEIRTVLGPRSAHAGGAASDSRPGKAGGRAPASRAGVVGRELGQPSADAVAGSDRPRPAVSRRGLLLVGASAAGVVTLATAGDRIPALAAISVLAQRGGSGPQGLPVNRTAAEAGVRRAIVTPDWTLAVVGAGNAGRSFSLAQLRALPQRTVDLPIACVEGWARQASWTGVPLGDLLDRAGVARGAARVVSLESGLYGRSVVPAGTVDDPLTLIALQLAGEDLHPDHGYPARLIAPGRPGALQTKWLTRIEVVS